MIGRALRLQSGESLLDFFSKFASSANSYLTLYQEYHHFEWRIGSSTAVLSYIDTPTAWIGAADPVGPQELWIPLIEAFQTAATREQKEFVILPTSEFLANQMAERGHFVAQIGSEPWIRLNGYRNKSDFMRALPVVRQIIKRAAFVEEFNPSKITADEHLELELLNKKWLDAKNSIPLGFLNRLDPWALMKFKKYFRLKCEGQTYGYLAAVPIPMQNAWYLVDLIRDPEAPHGTTELLVIEAMSHLQQFGAAAVTLGMAPLSPVSEQEYARHPKLYSILSFAYRNGNLFYGFKSLRAYKEKFQPDEWRPVYIVGGAQLSWRAWYGLFRAIYPQGFFKMTLASLLHQAKHLSLHPAFQSLLSQEFLTLPFPDDGAELVIRLKATLSLIAINILTMLLPGVLHRNLSHLLFNSALLFLGVGLIEILAGSVVACASYLAAFAFTNIFTFLVISPSLHLFHPGILRSFLHQVDFGNSLEGVLGCIGAMAYISKYPRAIAGTVIAASAIGCIVTRSAMQLNHIVAFIIGYLVASYIIN